VDSARSLSDESRKGLASARQRPSGKRLVIIWALTRLVCLLVAVRFLAALGTVHAQDATWDTNPGSSDWNTNTNWTPQTVPTGTATFGSSNTTAITFSSSGTLIGEMLFNPGAPNYSFVVANGSFFADGIPIITGVGIVNKSSNHPAITLNGPFKK
jgi:hypothetical protein